MPSSLFGPCAVNLSTSPALAALRHENSGLEFPVAPRIVQAVAEPSQGNDHEAH